MLPGQPAVAVVLLIAVTLTNIETILITGALKAPQVDVLSLHHARKSAQAEES